MAITARIPDDEAAVPTAIADLRRQIRELGPSVAASLLPVVSNLQTTIETKLATNYYTRAQTDARIAAPGNITPGSVSASGDVSGATLTSSGQVAGARVVSTQPLQSIGSYNFQVGGTNYKAAWLMNDGQLGYSPSTRRVKKDLEPLPDDLADAALGMGAYLGRYIWDEDGSPLKVFLIAEEAKAAGFGPDVVPVDEDGDPETVNYSQFVVPLLAVAKRHDSRLDDLERRLDALSV